MNDESLTPQQQDEQMERSWKLTEAFVNFAASHGFRAQELIEASLNCIEHAVSYIPEGCEDITIVGEKMVSNGQNIHALAKDIRDRRAALIAATVPASGGLH